MNNHHKKKEGDFQIDYDEYESITQAIVASIATIENTEVTEMRQLFEASDPEALDQLFECSDKTEELTVVMTIGEYLVMSENAGQVTISVDR